MVWTVKLLRKNVPWVSFLLICSWTLSGTLTRSSFYCPRDKWIFSWTSSELFQMEVGVTGWHAGYWLTNAFPEHMMWDARDKKYLFLCREGSQDWAKDRKSRPMQQEDEYRLHMELNRCLKKDTAAAGAEPDLFESQTTRTVSSRGLKSFSFRIFLTRPPVLDAHLWE